MNKNKCCFCGNPTEKELCDECDKKIEIFHRWGGKPTQFRKKNGKINTKQKT